MKYRYTTTGVQSKAATTDRYKWRWQTPGQPGPSGEVEAATAHEACRVAARELGQTIPAYGDGAPIGSPRQADATTQEGLHIQAVRVD